MDNHLRIAIVECNKTDLFRTNFCRKRQQDKEYREDQEDQEDHEDQEDQ